MAIKVLVVDDSAFMRKLVSEIINEQPDMEVVATARNGQDALKKLPNLSVDVITLDVEMPVMNGLETLEQIMRTKPLPVIMLSSITQRGSEVTLAALSMGAVDFITKPSGNISLDLRIVGDDLVAKIRSVAGIKSTASFARPIIKPRLQTIQAKKTTFSSGSATSKNIVAIGSSTGGPRALEEVFNNLPANLSAGIVVVQHMPKGFTRSLAERLNAISSINVREAVDGDYIEDGVALVAPGDYHMTINEDKQVRLNQDPPVQFLRPAVDVTMLTLPDIFFSNIVGVILTGMGKDGAQGMAAIKKSGGHTIAQDQTTSTIYSMPRAVIDQDNADYVLPLYGIAEGIVKLVNKL